LQKLWKGPKILAADDAQTHLRQSFSPHDRAQELSKLFGFFRSFLTSLRSHRQCSKSSGLFILDRLEVNDVVLISARAVSPIEERVNQRRDMVIGRCATTKGRTVNQIDGLSETVYSTCKWDLTSFSNTRPIGGPRVRTNACNVQALQCFKPTTRQADALSKHACLQH
jgi:hypothetical protein